MVHDICSANRRVPQAKHRRGGGFSLLEAVVALGIFATAGMALYAMYNTNITSLFRVQDVAGQMTVVRHVAEYLSTVNPSAQQQGELTFDGYSIRWQATLVEPVRPGLTVLGGATDFDVGLYDVQFDIVEDERPVGSWQMRLIGYENVAGPPPDIIAL